MIPLFTLERQNKIIWRELQEAIKEVVDSNVFILGPKVSGFEEAFAKYIGVKYAVGVASGTDALSLALLSVGVGVGDEVIIPANSYPTVFAVTAIGAVPKLVDIDPNTFTIDPSLIEKAITPRTKAIIPVHLYGQLVDIQKILDIGKKYNIPVIEDCAQGHGAEYKGKKVGSIGKIGCFSFYPTKNLGCLGDGGMVTTNDEEIYKKLKLMRMYGEEGRYNSILLGRNSRLDELQAAILLVKLKYLDRWNKRRREIAGFYRGCTSWEVQPPRETSYARHIYHLFVVRCKKRDQLKKYLEEKDIGTGIHYPTPIHLVPSMKFLGYKKGDFPESEKACGEILSLPMFPELKREEVNKVATEINDFGQHD